MNKHYSFRIKIAGSYGTYTFSIPYENGFVRTNKYCPSALLMPYSSSLIVGHNQKLSETEFIQDCNNFVGKLNTFSNLDVGFCFGQALREVVREHINRCGRLIFNDLLSYMDVYAYLMEAIGCKESMIMSIYPTIVKYIVDETMDYVVDAHTLRPFHQSMIYHNLCQLSAQ